MRKRQDWFKGELVLLRTELHLLQAMGLMWRVGDRKGIETALDLVYAALRQIKRERKAAL